jgi:hypothetical protein
MASGPGPIARQPRHALLGAASLRLLARQRLAFATFDLLMAPSNGGWQTAN